MGAILPDVQCAFSSSISRLDLHSRSCPQLLDITNPHVQGFTISLGTGAAYHRCLVCNGTFEQTDEGWAALKRHGFDAHEQGMQFPWSELNGKTVTMAVVEQEEEGWSPGKTRRVISLMARTEDGTTYMLPEPTIYDWQKEPTGWKWKFTSGLAKNLKLLTRRAAE